MQLLKRAQEAFIRLTVHAERVAGVRELRSTVIGTAKAIRTPFQAKRMITMLAEEMVRHQDEVATWVPADALARGEGGAFDACDLRHWLALAERAGVPAIPAREILVLEEDEFGALSGEVNLPDTAAVRSLKRALKAGAEELVAEGEAAGEDMTIPTRAPIDLETLHDRLADAMDDVPEGWMVRLSRCGGSNLKSLAGFGIMSETAPEVRFGPNLEVGPGWVRVGNRRRVDVSDRRTLEGVAQGPGQAVFLARPWQVSSRYLRSEDPHRHGTPFAGKGVWPAEWRAIVVAGEVTGVASYYGWADAPTPESARQALAVRDLAQRIVDEAMRQKAWPRYWDAERRRRDSRFDAIPGYKEALNSDWGRETVSCTLDFIETAEGPLLLEGGPAVSPAGGGHPCAFAGPVSAREGHIPRVSGVAFRAPEGVLIADPSTFDREFPDLDDVHWSWERVEALAATPEQPA